MEVGAVRSEVGADVAVESGLEVGVDAGRVKFSKLEVDVGLRSIPGSMLGLTIPESLS